MKKLFIKLLEKWGFVRKIDQSTEQRLSTIEDGLTRLNNLYREKIIRDRELVDSITKEFNNRTVEINKQYNGYAKSVNTQLQTCLKTNMDKYEFIVSEFEHSNEILLKQTLKEIKEIANDINKKIIIVNKIQEECVKKLEKADRFEGYTVEQKRMFENYKKLIDKDMTRLKQVVDESEEKVDLFKDTYQSMLIPAKKVGKLL